jgi:hypothetical protein
VSPDLGTIITALHDSEISGEASWFYDGVWRVKLGDDANGIEAEAVVSSPSEAAEWLRGNAVRCYPAKLFPAFGAPMMLGAAAQAHIRLVVWCRSCGHQVEPDPVEQAQRYGAETSVLEWRARLVCSQCGSRNIDMVLTGARRR